MFIQLGTFILLVLSTSIAFGFNLSKSWNQSSYGQFVNSEEKNISTNFGFGLYQNRMQVKSNYNLETTNNNFYIISARLNKAHILLNLPGKSANEERIKKGSSQFNAYSFSYHYSENLNAQLSFFKMRGFYFEDTNTNLIYTMPNLENRQINLTGHYTFNKNHKSFYTEPMIYEKGVDSESWIIVGGIKSIQMSQINELMNIPELTGFENYSSIQLYGAELIAGYSKNWFWNHFFLGGAYGLGFNMNNITTQLKNTEKKEKIKIGNSYFVSMTTGYIWEKSKIAIYANLSNSSVQIDEIPIGQSGGSTGLYYGYSF